jgi:hypothetical protein
LPPATRATRMRAVRSFAARLPSGHGIERGSPLRLTLDGRAVTAYEGETVAAVLLAEGHIETRVTVGGAPRGVYCGMGVCSMPRRRRRGAEHSGVSPGCARV